MPELRNQQAKRLYRSILDASDEATADRILSKLPLGKTPTPKQRLNWACDACKALSDAFDEPTLATIRKNCHCTPSPVGAKKLMQQWAQSATVEAFAALATEEAEGGFTLTTEGGDTLLLTYPTCYCPFLRNIDGDVKVPKAWCLCTVGYTEDLYTQVFGSPCSATLLESVACGGQKCAIRIKPLQWSKPMR